MQFSEPRDKIFPAFVKAQKEFTKAAKDSTNPFFNSKYADLNAYLDGSATGLQNNDLAVLQDVSTSEDGATINVTTHLIHVSGQWIKSGTLSMKPADNKPVTVGSCETYCRRYSLSAFFNMGAKDDDGSAASKIPPHSKKSANVETNKLEPVLKDVKAVLGGLSTLDGFDRAKAGFQKKYGPEIWGVVIWQKLFEETQLRLVDEQAKKGK